VKFDFRYSKYLVLLLLD